MKKQLLLILIATLFILPLISAESSFIFQQNKATDLKISCLDIDSAFCNNQTNCLITIYSPPNQTLLIDNQNMTWHSNYFNYSLNGSQLSVLGIYNVVIQCIGETTGFSTFNFEITPTGELLDTSDSFLYIGILLLLLTLFVLSLYKMSNANSIGLLAGTLSIAYFLLIGLVFMSGKIVNNFIPGLQAIGSFLDTSLIILIICLFPLILSMIMFLLYKALNEKEIGKMQTMGYSEAEARQFNKRK
jgi:hypothetical protein